MSWNEKILFEATRQNNQLNLCAPTRKIDELHHLLLLLYLTLKNKSILIQDFLELF